ncbi:unnamed protein product [Coregonus sp. 'balchen']|nr:unnamed protein product [Coregonus sp. 'balchen']
MFSFRLCLCLGSDLSDYFNYGFNEDSWKAYCEKQRRLRMGYEVMNHASATKLMGRSAHRDRDVPFPALGLTTPPPATTTNQPCPGRDQVLYAS